MYTLSDFKASNVEFVWERVWEIWVGVVAEAVVRAVTGNFCKGALLWGRFIMGDFVWEIFGESFLVGHL